MPGFRNRRISLLVLAILLSGLFIAAPWKSPQKEGAPLPNVARGPNWGIDITGGSRIMLQLEATQVTIDLPQNSFSYADNIENRFKKNLESPVKQIVKENIEETGRLTIEIGKYVSDNLVNSLIRENAGEKLLKTERRVSQSTQEDVKNSLKTRVDPYGTLGAQFKPMGEKNQFLQFEVALDLDEAKRSLGKEGLPEVFVDNYRVIWSEHLKDVSRGLREGDWGVSFTLTDEGEKRFADYTGRREDIEDKKGHPGVIYLDRPSDSVILYTANLGESIKGEVSQIGIESAENIKKVHRWRYKVPDRTETILDEGHWFYIQVPTVQIEENRIHQENYILSLMKEEEINKAILLGKKDEFSEEIIRNDYLILKNGKTLPLENSTKLKDESNIQWFNRVVGLESWPTLQPSITASEENLGEGLRITTGSGESEEAKNEAEDLRVILSQRLPVNVTHISEKDIGGRLSSGFVREAAIAAIVAFIAVGVLVFSFYRKIKIVIPLLLTMTCEVVITLGAASAVPDGLMSIGLPGLGGLIAVVGTGVDHQIIITDEVLGEKFSQSGKLPIDRRTGRAFSVIFSAAATTIAAMIALAAFGFGAMRGFAIVTLFGVLISVLITRPAYARIIGTLLEREQEG